MGCHHHSQAQRHEDYHSSACPCQALLVDWIFPASPEVMVVVDGCGNSKGDVQGVQAYGVRIYFFELLLLF